MLTNWPGGAQYFRLGYRKPSEAQYVRSTMRVSAKEKKKIKPEYIIVEFPKIFFGTKNFGEICHLD